MNINKILSEIFEEKIVKYDTKLTQWLIHNGFKVINHYDRYEYCNKEMSVMLHDNNKLSKGFIYINKLTKSIQLASIYKDDEIIELITSIIDKLRKQIENPKKLSVKEIIDKFVNPSSHRKIINTKF